MLTAQDLGFPTREEIIAEFQEEEAAGLCFETTWDTPTGPVRVWQDLPICHDGLCRGFEDY
jgi:hypothetical protein